MQHSLEKLRSMLIGYRWSDFTRTGRMRIENVTYFARAGLFLRRPFLVTMAQGQYVTMKHIELALFVTLRYELTPHGEETPYVRSILDVQPVDKMKRDNAVLDPRHPGTRGFDIGRLGRADTFNKSILNVRHHDLVIDITDYSKLEMSEVKDDVPDARPQGFLEEGVGNARALLGDAAR